MYTNVVASNKRCAADKSILFLTVNCFSLILNVWPIEGGVSRIALRRIQVRRLQRAMFTKFSRRVISFVPSEVTAVDHVSGRDLGFRSSGNSCPRLYTEEDIACRISKQYAGFIRRVTRRVSH